LHAAVLDGQDTCANLGYIVDEAVYHPVNDRALASLNGWIGEHGNTAYRWLPPGTDA